MHKNKQK